VGGCVNDARTIRDIFRAERGVAIPRASGDRARMTPLSPRRWLSTTIAVDRASYVASGAALMAAKYAIEAAIVAVVCGSFWPPWVFLSPLASMRQSALGHIDEDTAMGVLVAIGVISLPFLAIGLSMSVRRAADAGLSPWTGLAFAVPGLNYLTMLVLALAPSRPRVEPAASSTGADSGAARAASIGVLAASALGVAVAFVASDRLALYGATIFFALPIAMGAIAGYLVNRDRDRGLALTLGTGAAATLVTGGALLLFALEGAVCVLMAAPIGLVAVSIGALVGRAIATSLGSAGGSGAGPTLACIALLPALASVEHATTPATVYEVRTTLEVDASPDVVWRHVIAFPELPPATEWYFRSGIAVPQRARIDGEGVGAIRHCEFSTGAFVEPITAWEPGRRLAFDVTEQPPPMEEWSPYRHLHPPHLDASLRSVRGEFRMVSLADGRTRLEGSTWYTLALAPEPYFRLWSDALVHRIHLRVLEHVRRLAETE
jgi:hypothetical protein